MKSKGDGLWHYQREKFLNQEEENDEPTKP